MRKFQELWHSLPLFVQDLTDRVIRTFVASFGMIYLGEIIANQSNATQLENLVDWGVAEKAATAGFLAAGSLILGLLTKSVGSKNTASTVESLVPYGPGEMDH